MTIPPTTSELQQASIDIYSSDKTTRKNGRAFLIRNCSFASPLTLTAKEQSLFPSWHNFHEQIYNILTTDRFPYSIKTKKSGKIYRILPLPTNIPELAIPTSGNIAPGYIVTMAHAPKLGNESYIDGQLNLLKEEGFEENITPTELSSRLAIVVGMNYCHGLDPQKNRDSRNYMSSVAARISASNIASVCFSWTPIWETDGAEREQVRVKRLYRFLSELAPAKAQKILTNLMAKVADVIPYQLIREEIKNNISVLTFYRQMKHGNRKRPCFLVSWDDDAIRLRTEQNKGLFSHYDDLIKANRKLAVATTGYYMANPDKPFVEFASRADLVARRAIARTLPNGSYFPEPNTIIRIDHEEDLKGRISFIRKTGPKTGLEFLALLENLQLMKGDVTGRVVFGDKGAIQTAQSPKVKLAARAPTQLTPATLNNAANLAGLRKFYQSVLDPKKGFAASVARAMPTGTGTQINTALISKLYTAFDPVEYIKSVASWQSAYPYIVNQLVTIYNAKISQPDRQTNFTRRTNDIMSLARLDLSHATQISQLLTVKTADIWNARKLVDNKLLDDKQFLTLFTTVLNTNRAVYDHLMDYISR